METFFGLYNSSKRKGLGPSQQCIYGEIMENKESQPVYT